jgi:hypothetical protein
MGPTLRALAARAGRAYLPLDIMGSMRMHSTRSEARLARGDTGPTWNNLRDPEENRPHVGLAEMASWFDFLEVHKVPRIKEIIHVPYLDIILQIRDPRDMLASHLVYMNQKTGLSLSEEQKESYLLDLIEYEMQYLVVEFVEAINMKNIYSLRFEDVHLHPLQTYKHLLAWLDWRMEITEADLEHDISLGSFKMQSGGTIERGAKDLYTVTSTGSSIRKGIIGDWRNHFTPKSIEFFKSKCGEALVELGYEKSGDW